MGHQQVSWSISSGALVATIVVSVTATLGLSAPSAAAPLPSNASSDVTVSCLGQSDRIFAEMALNLGCDRATTSSQGVGQALTTFSDYPGPVADVQASYQGTSYVFHSGTRQGVNTYAEVAFDAAVQSIKDSPVAVFEIPVKIVAPYSMNASATIAEGDPASINAAAAVGLWAPAVDLVEKSASVSVWAGDSAFLEGSFIVSGMFQTGGSNTVNIRIRAQCFAGGGTAFSIPGSAECQSIIDPIFLFDQDLFDGIMGEDTFALADYFELGLSGNVAQPVGVPEPSTFPLLALGLVAVAVLGRGERPRHAAGWIRRARLA